MCFWSLLTVAIVPAQATEVRELGVVHGAQTRNRRAPIQKQHAASATGTRR